MTRIGLGVVLLLAGAATLDNATAQTPNERSVIRSFFDAFNSGDADRVMAFYEANATEDFRSRRSDEEDRALFRQIYDDTGPLDIEALSRKSKNEVSVSLSSKRIPMPVRFVFTLTDDATPRIDGYSIGIGGPDPSASSFPGFEIPAGADSQTVKRAIERYLGDLAQRGESSGVVLVARDGKPLVHAAYGLANRASGIPVGEQTRFDVGSITKAVTKVAIGQLARDGKLKLEDTILDHLPDFPKGDAAGKITVEQLLDHRSGPGDIFNERFERTAKETLTSPKSFFPIFADEPLQFEPGEGKRYSNAGYVVLGAIVEAASDRPYEKYLQEKIFGPAAMNDSGFPLRDGRLLGPGWTDWYFTGTLPESKKASDVLAGYAVGIAGGAPGVNAALESDGRNTIIVLANLDPPVATELAMQLNRALTE